jgi:formylglycine-generating enzyme required for sulfatase activity
VANGLLFWPFEDPRFSVRRGEFMVTNGRDWRWRELAGSGILHVHAFYAHGTALYAATGGFAAGLQRSDDGGRRWRVLYEHRNPPGSFSRLLRLGALGGSLYAGMYASDEPGIKLARWRDGTLMPVRGWPRGESADALTPHRGWLYAIHTADGRSRVWRTDGARSEPVRALAGVSVRALAAGAESMWAVGSDAGGGALWRSRDGTAWAVRRRFAADEPIDLTVYAGRVYVGARGRAGHGVLYGPAPPAPVASARPVQSLSAEPAGAAPASLSALLEPLDRALADSVAFDAQGGQLVDLLDPIVRHRTWDAGVALSERLASSRRTADASRFVGRSVRLDDKLNWQLLRAIAQTGHGRVPVGLLAVPWRAAPHRSEKYVEAVAGAAWAIGALRQADDETIAALLARLAIPGDPPWLAGDLVGALAAVSGCRFGYDLAAWRAWALVRRDCSDGAVAPDLVAIPGGTFVMGDPSGERDEAPRTVAVRPFRLMRLEVTNRDFSRFVETKRFVTDAERRGAGYVWTDRWREVAGADWRHPQGSQSRIEGLDTHPVVQVSVRDAAAYCAWRGLRLPTESEWEFAARGTDGRRYPWGNEAPTQLGERRANFGTERCCAPDDSDGYARTAPVGSYPAGASPFGALDLAGNVWEWTASAYDAAQTERALRGGGWGNDPYGLRSSYRHGNPPDIGLDMVGFRCAGD